jgi:hypothetical protein
MARFGDRARAGCRLRGRRCAGGRRLWNEQRRELGVERIHERLVFGGKRKRLFERFELGFVERKRDVVEWVGHELVGQ